MVEKRRRIGQGMWKETEEIKSRSSREEKGEKWEREEKNKKSFFPFFFFFQFFFPGFHKLFLVQIERGGGDDENVDRLRRQQKLLVTDCGGWNTGRAPRGGQRY